MFKYNRCLIIFGFFLGPNIFAVSYPVVKVASFPCAKPSQTRFGSGVAFEKDGKSYVLTSDHVLYHGNPNDGACHRVFSEKSFDSKAASLLAVNIGKGLGLLQVESGGFEETWGIRPIVFSELMKDLEPTSESFLGICGYPYASHRLFCDKGGQVLSNKSDRTILPFVREVIEVNGHNEYGMSGGGMFGPSGHFEGLVSHHYLQLVVGGPTKLIESNEGMNSGELIALGIPRKLISEWLKHFFDGQIQDLRYDISVQLRGKNVLSLEGVRFTPRLCSDVPQDNAIETASFADGDPVGIGGNVSVEGNICDVVLSLEKGGGKTQKWPFPERLWFTRVKDKIASGSSAVITGLFSQGKKYPLRSLLNLLSKIEMGVTPTIKISDPFIETKEVVKEILTTVPKVRSQSGYLREKFFKDVLIRDLLDQVMTIADLCEGKQFELVDLQEFKQLLRDSLWKELMVEEIEATVELKGALYRVMELLRKIQG